MNYIKYLYSLPLIFSLQSCQQKKAPVVDLLSFENTLNVARNQESITINRKQISTVLGKIETDSVPVLLSQKGNIIPFQLDDIDNDNQWDEFILALDFKPLESIQLKLKKIHASAVPIFKNYTNIRFGVGVNKQQVNEVKKYSRTGDPRKKKDSLFFQMEGPGWENNKVGFRNYFDPRNGIDIFGKTTQEMVLDSVGLSANYHYLENWGMDILKVGNSLGAGAIAIKTSDDKLHRVSGIASTEFTILKEGPLKSVFELVFKDSKFNNQTFDITHRISICKGEWGYKSEIFFSGIETPISLVTGIVNLKPNKVISENIDNYFTLKSYGKQSENKDFMSMAILTNNNQYVSHEKLSAKGENIVSTYTIEMKANNENPSVFYFITGWEKSNKQFASKEGFDQVIHKKIKSLNNPIVIK